jgi:hypothetical protein
MITASLRSDEIEGTVRGEANALAKQRAREVERAEDLSALAFGNRITGWRFLPYFVAKRYLWLIAPAPSSLKTAQVVMYDPRNDCIMAVRHHHGKARIVAHFSFADLF